MGIWFDRLCRVAELWESKEWKNVLLESSLFVFDEKSFHSKSFKQCLDLCHTEDSCTKVVMPFDYTVIELPFACAVFWKKAIGDEDTYHVFMIAYNSLEGSYELSEGVARFHYWRDCNGHIDYHLSDSHLLNESLLSYGEHYRDFIQSEDERDDIFLSRLEIFCACLMSINLPSEFIFETTPIKVRQNHAKSGRILRTHERPTYTLLTPGAIKKRFGHTGEATASTGGPKAPHPRRAHMRTLQHERFGKNQGKQILIPACWVGPTEHREGNKIYRVRLDK